MQNYQAPPTQFNVPTPPHKPEGSNTTAKVIIGILVVAILILGFILLKKKPAKEKDSDESLFDTEIADDESEDLGRKPEIKYILSNQDNLIDENSKIFALIDGEKVLVGTIKSIFGKDYLGHMEIHTQRDFDNDGNIDALVFDANIGSAGGRNYAFISYAGNNKFNISNTFSTFYGVQLTPVNSTTVVDLVTSDLGQTVVKERYALQNGRAVSLPVPQASKPTVSYAKKVKMDGMEQGEYFYFDIDNDGHEEIITTTGDYHFGRDFTIYGDNLEVDFSVQAEWGCGTLYILNTSTNGMRDIMTEDADGSRIKYRFRNGTYHEESL